MGDPLHRPPHSPATATVRPAAIPFRRALRGECCSTPGSERREPLPRLRQASSARTPEPRSDDETVTTSPGGPVRRRLARGRPPRSPAKLHVVGGWPARPVVAHPSLAGRSCCRLDRVGGGRVDPRADRGEVGRCGVRARGGGPKGPRSHALGMNTDVRECQPYPADPGRAARSALGSSSFEQLVH